MTDLDTLRAAEQDARRRACSYTPSGLVPAIDALDDYASAVEARAIYETLDVHALLPTGDDEEWARKIAATRAP